MKKILLLVFIILHTQSLPATQQLQQRKELAIVDTTQQDEWLYQQFIEILKSVGYNVTYLPLDIVIDKTLNQLRLPHYDAVLFIFGGEFLGGIKTSHLCRKVLTALENYAKLKDKVVGLVFPSLRSNTEINLLSSLYPVFDGLGLKTPRSPFALKFPQKNSTQDQHSIDAFFYLANNFLSIPLETRPLPYHTTLSHPRSGITFYNDKIRNFLGENNHPLFLLPLKQECNNLIKKTLPYGLYWFNPKKENHVFLTTKTLLTFSGISESFHICPVDFKLRSDMNKLVQQMMWEVALLSRYDNHKTGNNLVTMLRNTDAPALPRSVSEIGKHKIKKEGKPHKIAWMEILVFQEKENETPKEKIERIKQQNDLIDYIVQSGLSSLWISFNPHMYYSNIGRLADKNKEKIFIDGIALFNKKLKSAYNTIKKDVPSILVGFEITNNIYEPNLPKLCAVDLYEGVYPDLPAPLSKDFWGKEITQPLEHFVKKWNNPEVSHGIPLSGVVLDLEMYCRKKTGTFYGTMGFDGYTFRQFSKKMKFVNKNIPLRDRSLILMKHKCGAKYFNFLEKKAESIGSDLKQSFDRLIPHGQIMCYLPYLMVSWFYKGLSKGLASKSRPLHLLTFNNEFIAHQEWFRQQKLPAIHSSVLMLSKIKSRDNFSWIDTILTHHHGIWLNRFSRLIERKSRDWTSIEQPAIPHEQYTKFLYHLETAF